MQDKHIDELQEFLKTLKIHNKDLDVCFNDAVAVGHLERLIKAKEFAILERLKRESRELIEFNKTEPLNVGEIQNVELIRAVPIEAIQQQIDRIGGKNEQASR